MAPTKCDPIGLHVLFPFGIRWIVVDWNDSVHSQGKGRDEAVRDTCCRWINAACEFHVVPDRHKESVCMIVHHSPELCEKS